MFGEKQILRYAQDDTLPLAFVVVDKKEYARAGRESWKILF